MPTLNLHALDHSPGRSNANIRKAATCAPNIPKPTVATVSDVLLPPQPVQASPGAFIGREAIARRVPSARSPEEVGGPKSLSWAVFSIFPQARRHFAQLQ